MRQHPHPFSLALVALTLASLACQRRSSTEAPTQPATPLEGKLEIASTSSYINTLNYYNVSGEVVNHTSHFVANITLSISITDVSGDSVLLDGNDNPVDHIDIQPYFPELEPGESTPFTYEIFIDSFVQPAKYEVSISKFEQLPPAEIEKISTENTKMTTMDNGNITITGEIVNQSPKQVDVYLVTGTLLDNANTFLAANSALAYVHYLYPAGDANGRDRSPFFIKFFGPLPNASQYKVKARAVENTTTPSANMDVRVTSSYVDTHGTYHLVGAITNNGSSQILPTVFGGLYGSDKTVLDAASLGTPLYLNAGESGPFDLNIWNMSMPHDQASHVEKIVEPDPYWTVTTDYEVASLEAKGIQVIRDGTDWTVTGTAVNTSQKLSSIHAVILFLDKDQQVMATNSIIISPPKDADVIHSGDSIDFSIPVYVPAEWDLKSHNYRIILQGVVAK